MAEPSTGEMATACLDEDAIIELVERRIDPSRLMVVQQHLAACSMCRRLVSEMVRIGVVTDRVDSGELQTIEPEATPRGELPRGTTIGRYVIVSMLGRGGMGVVYRAYDPDLNRQIALKLVGLGSVAADARDDARQRLMREAQALAKLSHPNVVTVHDVGVVGDDVFIAMELVAGATLRTWLYERKQAPREILRVFRAAGEGLAAAHRVGVVHRDFKPDNVMIGNDGRVRVLDFGLARLQNAGRASRPSLHTMPGRAEITHVGVVMGTPAYMSPEQDAGLEAGAPSDQFSYCVALYEALFGALPYPGETYAVLAMSRANGQISPPPKMRGVTSRIRRALIIGLRATPGDRHRDVDALLGELRPRAWTSPRVLAVAVVAALVLGIGGSSLIWRSMSPPGPSCKLAAGEASAVWNPERRDRLARSFTSVHPRGAEIATRVGDFVDHWIAEWAQARTQLCEMSTRADDHLEESRVADRLQCLQRRITELDGALSVLGITESATTVDSAVDAITHVHPATECAQLVSTSPTPADIEAAKPILGLIVKARSAEGAGHIDDALALAKSAVETARTIHSPAIGAALEVLGDAQGAHGEFEAARATYHEAASAAAAIHEDGMVADAWIAMIQLSFRDRKLDDTLRAAMFSAELAVTRLPDDDARRPSFHYSAGTVHVMEGHYREAITELELAISEYQKLDAARYTNEIAIAENSLGLVYADQGEWAKAKERFEHLEARLRTFGPDTPQLGIALGNLAMLAAYQEHYDEAEALLLQTLAIYNKQGPTHPLVGEGELNLGQLYSIQGHCTRAAPHLAKARDVLAAAHGADSPVLAMVTMEQGRCLRDPRAIIEVETRARAIAVAHPVSVRELPEIDFILAQATARTRGGRAKARELAASARDALTAIGAGTAFRVRMIDRWLAAH